MKQALLEHIEAKVINFLRDMKAPIHASQIAVHIQERREDTLQAIQRLVKNGTIKDVQNLVFFNSTGEVMAYTLADAALQQTPVAPSVPPTQLTPPPQRGSAYK
ncbi:MAG: hypothetical protein WBN22_02150 [Verrucomicrobiia bacterium]